MKYITHLDDKIGPVLLTFSGNVSHKDAAKAFGVSEVRSAGFISLTSTGLYCHGSSQSLGVASLVSDSKLANSLFR